MLKPTNMRYKVEASHHMDSSPRPEAYRVTSEVCWTLEDWILKKYASPEIVQTVKQQAFEKLHHESYGELLPVIRDLQHAVMTNAALNFNGQKIQDKFDAVYSLLTPARLKTS